MLQAFKVKLSNGWTATKLWFKNSEVIFLARAEAFVGLAIAAVSSFDWSPLVAMGTDAAMSIKQGVYLGGVMFVKGLVTEWARRRNDPYLAVKTAVAEQEVIKAPIAKAKKEILKTVKEVK